MSKIKHTWVQVGTGKVSEKKCMLCNLRRNTVAINEMYSLTRKKTTYRYTFPDGTFIDGGDSPECKNFITQ